MKSSIDFIEYSDPAFLRVQNRWEMMLAESQSQPIEPSSIQKNDRWGGSVLRTAIALNTFLTLAAVGFSIWIQQMTPMMVRAGNFERFRDRVSDADRDAILRSAAEAVWVGIVPLVLTNVAWIAILYFTMIPRVPVKPQPPT